jgi:hypothetical protein
MPSSGRGSSSEQFSVHAREAVGRRAGGKEAATPAGRCSRPSPFGIGTRQHGRGCTIQHGPGSRLGRTGGRIGFSYSQKLISKRKQEQHPLIVFRSIRQVEHRRAVGTHYGPTQIHQAGHSPRHQRDGRAGTTIIHHLRIYRRTQPLLSDDCKAAGAAGLSMGNAARAGRQFT